MSQTTLLTIRIDEGLKARAQQKAEKLGLGLGTLTKLFFKSLVDEAQIKFYVGDEIFDEKLATMLKSKQIKKALRKLGKSV